MVQLTDRAIEQLEAIRDENALPPDQGVTLVATETGELGFAISSPQPEDEVHERDGKTVMIVPQILVEALDGVVLDFDDTPGQEGFTLDRA